MSITSVNLDGESIRLLEDLGWELRISRSALMRAMIKFVGQNRALLFQITQIEKKGEKKDE